VSTMPQAPNQPNILDGAMGSLLDERGIDTTLLLWSARALLDAPEAVLQIHHDYLQAGAQVLTTNTFRTHRRSLAKAVLGDQSAELTHLAVDLARQAVESSPGASENLVGVAGSISPLEDCYRPDLAPDYDEALAEHREMARDLADAGVDLLLVETMPAWPEAQAALTAALATGLPVWFSLHTREPGVLLAGDPLEEAFAGLNIWPDAMLINCIPAERAEADVRALRAIVPAAIPIGVYANTGHVDPVKGWSTEDRIDPERYAELAARWFEAGASIIGGCCGTTPAHIAALATTLGHANRLRP
jgi:S-methylmethionine-dependent homocysteine/selenocysteine methylase